jgi:diguanylate cyclase (GGDEF)-like protein/PAS domain S-box-containing protein
LSLREIPGGLPVAASDGVVRELLEASEHIVYRLDLVRGGYDYISPIAASIYGLSLDDLQANGLRLLRDRLFERRAATRLLRHVLSLCRKHPGQAIRTRVDYCLRNVRGEPVWHSNSMTVAASAAGRPLSASGISVDVTARHRDETALRESEEKYRATMNCVQVGVFVLQDLKFRFVNPKLCEMFAYSADECIDKMSLADLVPAEQRDLLIDKMQRRAAGEPGTPYEVVGMRKDGSRFPLLVLGEPGTLKGRPASVGTLIDLTPQRRVEQALNDVTRRYVTLFEGAQDAIIVADGVSGLIVDANVEAELLFGRPHEEIIGMHHLGLHPPHDAERYREIFARHASNSGGEPEELEIITADGETVAIEISANMVETATGQRLVQSVFRDIRRRKRDEMELQRAARVFESSQQAIVLTDAELKFVSVNPAFVEMSGYRADEVIGKSTRLLSSGRHSTEFIAAVRQAIIGEGKWQGEFWSRRKNGELFPVWLTLSVHRDAAGRVQNYVVIATDISERLAAQEHIRQLAYFDSLTRLPNRRLLQDRAEQALASADRESSKVALLFVDLDHFKTINDSLGHSAGDQLLTEVANRLLGCVRRMDTVARLGGDEFVVLLSEATLEGTAEVARKILEVVARPCWVERHELGVTPSLGISLFPQDGRNFETLLKHADTAMYRAKEAGRNTYQFFANEMNVAALERLVLENSLRQGLERGEFVLHYQPQINVASGRIVGAEALIRWNHPQIGLVPPGKFIPVAEVSGLIVAIGEWVLREACRQNWRWQQAGLAPISVAVNISSVQFRGGHLERNIRAALADTGLAAQYLELELTEGIVMGGANETVQTLLSLSAMGLKLSIDDFGTGYSSLSYLKRFPIDKLKIDQSFVRDIVTDPDDWAIASAVISLGHSLRLGVIAEGVEHAEQLDMLRRQGCDEVQGYHFSVPLPADEFAELLLQQKFVKKG